MNAKKFQMILFLVLSLTGIFLSGCNQSKPKPTFTPALPSVTPTQQPTETPTLAPTFTPSPPLAVLLAPPGADSAQVQAYQSALDLFLGQHMVKASQDAPPKAEEEAET